jgi:hypothetical protein
VLAIRVPFKKRNPISDICFSLHFYHYLHGALLIAYGLFLCSFLNFSNRFFVLFYLSLRTKMNFLDKKKPDYGRAFFICAFSAP